MANAENPWSEADLETLTRMWVEGKTAGQISARIPGKSRSAVLGKINRLKLPPREKPKAKIKPRDTRPVPPAPRSKTFFIGSGNTATAVDPLPPRAEAFLPLAGSTPIAIMDHTTGCRWPVGDAPHYCNLPCEEKPRKRPTDPATFRVYCPVHTKMSKPR